MDYFINFNKITYVTSKRPDGCILCNVVKKDTDTVDLTVFQNEHFRVVVNLYPYNPGHLMLFPNRHLEDIREYTKEERQDYHEFLEKVLNVLDDVYHPHGYNLGYNMGLEAGASLKHLHQHIIPRYPRELGFYDLIAGKKLLVEDPFKSQEILKEKFKKYL